MTSSDSTRVGAHVSRGPDVDATFSPERTALLIIDPVTISSPKGAPRGT